MSEPRLFVGGIYGEEADVVSPSIEAALERTEELMSRYRTPSQQRAWEEGEGREHEPRWECELIDGWFLRCTTTMCVGEETHRLYVVAVTPVEGLRER